MGDGRRRRWRRQRLWLLQYLAVPAAGARVAALAIAFGAPPCTHLAEALEQRVVAAQPLWHNAVGIAWAVARRRAGRRRWRWRMGRTTGRSGRRRQLRRARRFWAAVVRLTLVAFMLQTLAGVDAAVAPRVASVWPRHPPRRSLALLEVPARVAVLLLAGVFAAPAVTRHGATQTLERSATRVGADKMLS